VTQPAGLPGVGPRGLTSQASSATDAPTDLRSGIVVAVTSRGIDVDVASGRIVGAAHLASYNPAVGDPVALVRFQDAWLVLDRPVGPGTALDLATPGSGAGTNLLGGTVLSGTGATLASSTGTAVNVPRYRCTYYHPPGHQVLILCGVSWYSSVTADSLWIMLWDAVSGVQASIMDLNQMSNNFFGHFETFGAMLQPATFGGRKVDLYMQVQRAGGTGTSRVDDIAARRGFMIALDMGDGSILATV